MFNGPIIWNSFSAFSSAIVFLSRAFVAFTHAGRLVSNTTILSTYHIPMPDSFPGSPDFPQITRSSKIPPNPPPNKKYHRDLMRSRFPNVYKWLKILIKCYKWFIILYKWSTIMCPSHTCRKCTNCLNEAAIFLCKVNYLSVQSFTYNQSRSWVFGG